MARTVEEMSASHFPTAAASEEGWISLPLADESEESQTSCTRSIR